MPKFYGELKAPLTQPAFGKWLKKACYKVGALHRSVAKGTGFGVSTISAWACGSGKPTRASIVAVHTFMRERVARCSHCKRLHVSDCLAGRRYRLDQNENKLADQARAQVDQTRAVAVPDPILQVTADPIVAELLTEIRDELRKLNEAFK